MRERLAPSRLAALMLVLLVAGSTAAAETGFSGGITLEKPDESRERTPASAPASSPSRDWLANQPENAPLRLLNAGAFENSSADAPAIALLFSGAFEPEDDFNDFLAVYRGDGSQVTGRWRISASPRLLYFSLPGPGTYTVRLRAGLADADGNRLPQSLAGPVTVQ